MIGAAMLLVAIASQAAPATIAQSPARVADTVVTDADRGPIAYDPIDGRIAFKARLAGREVWALLDNGADDSLIDLGFARDAGLQVDAPGGAVTSLTGSLSASRVRDVPVVVPRQFAARRALIGLDMTAAGDILGRKIALVIGADVLAEYAAVVDPVRHNFQLKPSGSVSPPASVLPITLTGKRPTLDIAIGGKPLTVAIDMGSNGSLSLTREAWTRIGGKGTDAGLMTTTGVDGRTFVVDTVKVAAVTIGPETVRDVTVDLKPTRAANGDGVLGMGILANYVMIMDIGAGKLWLIPRMPGTIDR